MNSNNLADQIDLITSKFAEQLETIQAEYQRWSDYKTDYDALENQLKTLPDNTTRTAMVPLGKLAFMPGKLIHTNEILVLLGDQYYAERSAKQAIEILGRRRQVVDENLRLAEAQLNSFKAKKDSLQNSGALATSDPQLNEEGLPIMEIREELPPIDEKEEEEKNKKKTEQRSAPKPSQSGNQLPESVLRARKMMEEADAAIDKQKKTKEDAENKALFDLLRELEAEEEEEEKEEEHEKTGHMLNATVNEKAVSAVTEADTSDESDNGSFSDDDDDDDDDRYDKEISENMFDRFGDDEEYPLDGVVDQEDFTCYEQDMSSQIPAATLREITNDEEELYEKSTPKVITKKKVKEPVASEVQEASSRPTETEPPKKLSKFKLAQLEKEKEKAKGVPVKETLTEKSPVNNEPMMESAPVTSVEAPKKKFSKFKLLRQEQKERPKKPTPVPITPGVSEVKEKPIAQPQPQPQPQPQSSLQEEEEAMHFEHKKPSSAAPPVVAAASNAKSNANKPKKMSRFKLERAQSHKQPAPEESTPLVAERIKPRRSVTWDTNTDVRDHDHTSAPSAVSETLSYTQPMKTESAVSKPLHQKIRSPADIFNAIRQTQSGEPVDDYPTLDDDADDKKVDLNELIQAARESLETIYRPTDGTESLIPIVKEHHQIENNKSDDQPNGILVTKKSNLDNKIMKGAVMERDIEPVDLEQVEEEMDLREITSSYHQKRQSMLAATGGFSFEPKPEFEVIEEELPLPKKNNNNSNEEEEEEVAPKKMSRFKAARLGMKMDTDDMY